MGCVKNRLLRFCGSCLRGNVRELKFDLEGLLGLCQYKIIHGHNGLGPRYLQFCLSVSFKTKTSRACRVK